MPQKSKKRFWRHYKLGGQRSLEVWPSINNVCKFYKTKSYTQWFYQIIMIQSLKVMWEWKIFWRASNGFTFGPNYARMWRLTKATQNVSLHIEVVLLVNKIRQVIKNQLVYYSLSLFPSSDENMSPWISYVSYQNIY